MPRPCHALTMPFFSRPRHSTAVERRPVGYPPAFDFFRLPRGVARRLLSEAYQSSSQRSIPTTVKSGISTLQKKKTIYLTVSLVVRIFSATTRTFTKDTALSEHAMCESAFSAPYWLAPRAAPRMSHPLGRSCL